MVIVKSINLQVYNCLYYQQVRSNRLSIKSSFHLKVFLNYPYLLLGQAVKLVDEGVDLLVRGVDLAL